jgi:hypothetical protein
LYFFQKSIIVDPTQAPFSDLKPHFRMEIKIENTDYFDLSQMQTSEELTDTYGASVEG